MKKPLIILGAGGFAREAYNWTPPEYDVICFYASVEQSQSEMFGLPLVSDLEQFRGMEFLVAVGSPVLREALWKIAESKALVPCKPIIHSTAIIGKGVEIGRGSIVCPYSIITTNVKIGRGFLMNLTCTVGHDCVFDDFVTLSPGANVSGNVKIGKRCNIGTNASIREKVTVNDDTVVGMGSVVISTFPPGSTVVGVPARQPHKQ